MKSSSVNLILCVHNHQPVDNFEHVFQRAYECAYRPFLEVIERYPEIKFCAHYSGPLLEWFHKNRVEMFLKIHHLVGEGRLELLGGGFYEPIFSMLPKQDMLGQIDRMQRYLKDHFGVEPQGIWLSERVWEPSLTWGLVEAGMQYTVLDDFHFKVTGYTDQKLTGYFFTEEGGKLLRIFPIKEDLRYSIPFKDPQWTIQYLLSYATPEGSNVIVYADDGEKFGIWPQTYKHVYEDGWLQRFLDALRENSDRIRTITFSEAIKSFPPTGWVYLPCCSYREMGEWALFSESQRGYSTFLRELKERGQFDSVKHFIPGGFWRNFIIKYPEVRQMYGRMLGVSQRVHGMTRRNENYHTACTELYKAQCNCGYWHGIFGGVYLPNLRSSIYHHLLEAEALVDLEGTHAEPDIRLMDVDLDLKEEIRISNAKLNLFLHPGRGGHILELDYKPARLNLITPISRRYESYHQDLHDARQQPAQEIKSIHDILLAEQKDLQRYISYDTYQRECLIDHIFSEDMREIGDFVEAQYMHQIERAEGVAKVLLKRTGYIDRLYPLEVQKVIQLRAKEAEVKIEYRIRNPGASEIRFIFSIEFSFGLLNQQSVYHLGDRSPLASISATRDFEATAGFGILDPWHRLDTRFLFSVPARLKVSPIVTVCKSEKGFELSPQGHSIFPHWEVSLAPRKERLIKITLTFEGV